MALRASFGKLKLLKRLGNNNNNNVAAASAAFSSTGSVAQSAAQSAQQFPDYVLRAPTTDVTTLDSGLRVASEGSIDDGSETATVGVWIDAGSRYETAATNGTAHFLEHMSFKGTSKRTGAQLEQEIQSMGGHLNAYTSREQTVYSAKVLKHDVQRTVEIFSDILLNSELDENAIETERHEILNEMTEVNKQQEELVLDHLHATAFQGTGLGQTILGSEQNIRNITRDDMVNYKNVHYTAPKMVIAGAGAVDHAQLCEYSNKYFGDVSSTSSGDGDVEAAMDPAVFTGSDYLVKFNSDDTAHIALAYQTSSWTSEHAFPLMLMQSILGSYDRTSGLGKNHASRLCQEVAEQELAMAMTSFNTSYKDTGLFGIYAVLPDKKVDDFCWTLMNNLVRLCHHVSDEEVERAKLALKNTMLTGLDGHQNIAQDIGRQLLTYGRRMTTAEVFSRIDAIEASDIKATASKFIRDQDHALAAVGGIHELPDYNWFRRHSYWIRY